MKWSAPQEVYEPSCAWLEWFSPTTPVLILPRWPRLQSNWVVPYNGRFYVMLRPCLSRQRGKHWGYYVQDVTPFADGPVSTP